MQIPKYIEIKTAAGQRAAFLSPKSDGLKDCFPDCRLNGESTLEFLLPATSPKIEYITPECQIWAAGRVYTLLRDEAVDTVRDENNKLWAKFMAVERWAELDTQYIEPYISNDPIIPTPNDLEVIIVSGGSDLSGGRYAVGSAAHALYAILQGSGWTVGTVDVTSGVRDLQTEKISRLQLIKEIQNKWGGYLVWDSVNKVVHLRDANTWQNYTGFQIRYRKNLEHITRTQSNKIVTKLYAFGHDGLLDIASVNGGLKYITNYSYTSRTYVGIYRNQDIFYQDELLEKATAELSLICRPRYLYKTKMVDLRTLPEYSHEDFSVGDMVDVIDPDVAPDSPRVRIIRHKYNLFQPWKCEIEIGDPQERLIEQLKASFSTTGFVDSKYRGNGQMSGYSIEDLTIEDAKIKNLKADKITAGTITATISIIGPTITGGTIRTAANGARIELTSNGIRSYKTGSTLHGLYCDPSSIYAQFRLYYEGTNYFEIERLSGGLYLSAFGNNMLGYDNSVNLTKPFGEWDFSSAAGIYGINWGDIETNPFGSSTPSSFASASHGHGNDYVKTGGGQNLKLQAFEGAEVNYVEVWLGSTFLGQVDLY
jgi:phage minor structural protein